jgi:hypothetical protein
MQSILNSDSGMMDSIKTKQLWPCTDCTLQYMTGSLEYANGTQANTDTNSWLHHSVMINTGKGRTNANCPSSKGDPFFSSGNERTVTAFTSMDGTYKSGYYIAPTETDSLIIYNELMNMDPFDKVVYYTVDYEYLPGKQADYAESRAIWFSIGPSQCGPAKTNGTASKTGGYQDPLYPASNLTDKQQPKTNVFAEHSAPWVSLYDGEIISTGGHLHDGGESVQLWQNGKQICDSVATYGGSPAYIQRVGGDMGSMPHISSMVTCHMVGQVKKGDSMSITANYNFNHRMG